MKLVFLAGPFRGGGSEVEKQKNIATARKIVRKFIENKIPYYSPHLNVSEETIGGDMAVDEYANSINAHILESCSVLAVLPGWQASAGTKQEIARAEKKGMPIIYLETDEAIANLRRLTT